MRNSRPKTNSLLILATLFLSLTLFASCQPGQGPPSPVDLPPAAEILAMRLADRQWELRRFAGKGTFDLDSKHRKNHCEMMVAGARPDQLYLKAIDLMGRPVFTMVTGFEELYFLDYREEVFYEGEATPENLFEFLPLDLNLSDAILLFAGGLPMKGYERATVEKVNSATGPSEWLLKLFSYGGRNVQQIYVSPQGLRVSKFEKGRLHEEPIFRIEYSDYREIADGRFVPFHIHLVNRESEAEMDIKYEEVLFNPDLPKETFHIEPPPGIKISPIIIEEDRPMGIHQIEINKEDDQ